ncbi:hypothetical protein FRC00_014522 [Tulasnella sp. 408]|nr:hypothetical protein FRC00_014522 [Tulasnella sp. 408]
MENYGKEILRILLYDSALNRQSLQVDPESQPIDYHHSKHPSAPAGVEFEDLKRAVRSVQRFLGEAIRAIAAESRSRRSSPSILPVELFLWVVKDVLADTDRHRNAGYYGQLTKLCLVCKEWADIIHGFPELWTQVNISSSREFPPEILSRSRDLPLDITYHLDLRSIAVGSITSESHRWRSLDIRSDRVYAIGSLLTRRAPRLQELIIIGSGYWASSTETKVFEDIAPELKVVTLRGCGLPWRSPILSDLKKLSLWKIEEHFPKLDALLDILASSPRLSELVIVTTRIQLGSDTSSRRVKLPNLRSLRVEYLYPEAMKAVINSIDVPLFATCIFSTELGYDEEVAVELADVSERLVALARGVGNDSATLTLKPPSMEIAGRYPGDEQWDAVLKYEPEGNRLGPLTITVNTYPMKHVGIFSYLSGRIQPYTKASPPKLRLAEIHSSIQDDEDTSLLLTLNRIFPNVEEIALVERRGSRGMLDVLRRLFTQPAGASPLFSSLTTLAIYGWSHRDWVTWLQREWERICNRGSVSFLHRNLTLRLEGGSGDTDGLQALQQRAAETLALYNVQVEWEPQRTQLEEAR